MYAQGVGSQRQRAAVAGDQRFATGQGEGLGGDGLGVVMDRAGLRTRDQSARAVVGAVGEHLEPRGDPDLPGQRLGDGVVAGGHQHQRELPVVGGDGAHHGTQQVRVAHHVVVERAVGLHVAHPAALDTADAVQRADLVEQHVFHFFRGAGHGTAAEADQVGVGRVGSDAYAMGHRQGDGAAHGDRVRCVEAAGDVGAIDEGHYLGIKAHAPGAEAFADVAVQEQAAHRGSSRCYRYPRGGAESL